MTGAPADKNADGPAGGASPSCWSCAGPVGARALFCHTCGAIQPPRAIDHFARLGLQPVFDLDGAELERRYFAFQRSFHPDRFASKSARERAFSLQHAVGLNEAYEVLKSPLKRAEYMLELEGHAIAGDGGATIDDPELLMEAMEMREELGATGDTAAADAVLAKVRGEIEGCVCELAAAFAAGDIERAVRLTTRYKYLDKLMEEARHRRFRLAGA